MTKRFNQGWITFDGTPVTGRVPTRVLIYADRGQTPNGAQEAGIAHAYKLFCDAVAGSAFPGGYHVARRVLPDGTTLEMVSNSHVHEVRVKLPPVKVPDDELLRGFVMRPVWEDGTFPDERRDPALVWHILPRGWFVKKQPYKPGSKTSTPTYFVDDRRTSHMVRGREIVSDQEYLDVFTAHEERIYKNGQAYRGVPEPKGVPVLLRTPSPTPGAPDIEDIFGVDGAAIYRRETVSDEIAWVEKFTRNAHIEVLAAGFTFSAGPTYDTTLKKIQYAVQNLTFAGALQVWHVGATLSGEDPWVTASATSFEQISVPGFLETTGGWTAVVRSVVGSPIWGISDPRSWDAYWVYQPPPGGSGSNINTYVATLSGNTLLPQEGSTENAYLHAKTVSDSDSAELYDGTRCGFTRQVVTDSELVVSVVVWYVLAAWGPIYRDSVGDADGYPYREIPGSFGAPTLNVGDRAVIGLTEDSKRVSHSDEATAEAYAGDLTIHEFSVQHTISDVYGVPSDSYPVPPPPATMALGGAGAPSLNLWAQPRDSFSRPVEHRREETFVFSVTTRDYFFYDKENDVRGWIECIGTANKTVLDGVATGPLLLEIKIKVSTPYGEYENDVASYTSTDPVAIGTMSPPDVNFGTSPVTWQYTVPPRPAPTYAPTWGIQGACPYIAYTTEAEHATGIEPRLMASFRLQLLWTDRPLDSIPPEMPNTVQFAPFMMEQLILWHWPNDRRALWETIETVMARIDASTPETMLAALGTPGQGDELHPQYYRT